MNQFRWRGVLVLPALLVLCPAAWAQQNTAHIGYVYPAGGRQGSTFSVVVGGQFLQGVSSVHFSGTGVRAAVTEYIKPMSPKEALELRDQLKALLDKKLGITPQQSLTSSSLKP